MIPIGIFKSLITNKIKDSKALKINRRFQSSLYMAGYAVELALKYKICNTLNFNQGFPETKTELSTYLNIIISPQPFSIKLSDIKNHDLNKLLFYSGVELKIRASYLQEWNVISQWNPEDRYKKVRVIETQAANFIKAATKIIKEIS